MDDLKDRDGKRRTWSKSEKRRIIAEALAPDDAYIDVARQHTLNLNLLYTWCRPFRSKLTANAGGTAIVPIEIREPTLSVPPSTSGHLMSIIMPSGIRVELDSSIDEVILKVSVRGGPLIRAAAASRHPRWPAARL